MFSLPQLLPASHVEAGGVHAVEEESAFEIGACAVDVGAHRGFAAA